MGRLPDQGTTRRIVSDFILKQRKLIVPPVVEVGSARPKEAWWADFRQQLDMDDAEWFGVDMQKSDCTDHIMDLTEMSIPHRLYQAHRTCICAEVLEHVANPQAAIWSMRQLLVPGSWAIVTTPFGFPIHGFPEDYWRFTPEGLKLLFRKDGWVDVEAWSLEKRNYMHRDHLHTEPLRTRELPLWVGAIARVPYQSKPPKEDGYAVV